MFIPPKRSIILVTGSNGQLGREFRKWAVENEAYEFLFTSRASLDICTLPEVLTICTKWQPTYIINCAAYTAVDKAEENKINAFAINEGGISNLIKGAEIHNSTIFNYSTDYVYHSIIDRPILEDDNCTPKGVYGQSKRAGEKLLEISDIAWINIRVSWLYSSYQNNFVKTMLHLGIEQDALTIVSDQQGCPTYAANLASDTMKIIGSLEESKTGLNEHYNYCNSGEINWADFARLIFKLENIACEVHNTTTEQYGAPAPRPFWSVMNTSKIRTTFNLGIIPTIEKSLQSCLDLLKQ
ncbi:MAG: dTDP-4-dehydrorhamnose reductase [Saprospiraceae bacterium]|jgi:dTDP-4-dehydrorhamnose reductase